MILGCSDICEFFEKISLKEISEVGRETMKNLEFQSFDQKPKRVAISSNEMKSCSVKK